MTNYGWAIHDTDAPVGTPERCVARGRFRTPADMEFVERYCTYRQNLMDILDKYRPDKVGIEFPVFDSMFSSGMYGLFLYSCEALKSRGMDTVFWSPMQVKAHARDSIKRPSNWQMEKPDMVEATRLDVGGKAWNHNEADAYLIGVLSGRFWGLLEGSISEGDLTATEKKYFMTVHTYLRGRKAGKTVKKGIIYREDDRFFLWSNLLKDSGAS